MHLNSLFSFLDSNLNETQRPMTVLNIIIRVRKIHFSGLPRLNEGETLMMWLVTAQQRH